MYKTCRHFVWWWRNGGELPRCSVFLNCRVDKTEFGREREKPALWQAPGFVIERHIEPALAHLAHLRLTSCLTNSKLLSKRLKSPHGHLALAPFVYHSPKHDMKKNCILFFFISGQIDAGPPCLTNSKLLSKRLKSPTAIWLCLAPFVYHSPKYDMEKI